MKLKRTLLAAAVALTTLSSQTFAQSENVKPVVNPWAECGIGGMLFKDTRVAAVISNVIWDAGTTAVTSMAASPETCEGARIASAVFVNESIDAIEADTAQGGGEHLTAMLALMGVEAEKHEAVTNTLRASIAANQDVLSLPASEKAQAFYALTEQAIKHS